MAARFHIGRLKEPHKAAKADPLKLAAGEMVRIGDEVADRPGWVQVTNASGSTGIVPKAWLELGGPDTSARLIHDFDETELSLRRGKVIIIGEESDWYWCVDRDKRYGWLPRKKVKLLE